jgi:hypothetical protein
MTPAATQVWTTTHPHVPDRRVVGVGDDYVLYERGYIPRIRRVSMRAWAAWVRENQAVVKQ